LEQLDSKNTFFKIFPNQRIADLGSLKKKKKKKIIKKNKKKKNFKKT